MTEKNQITSVYTDVIDVNFNMFNVTLFIKLMEDGPLPIDLGKVKMSPQTAKGLVNALQRNIEKYEELYGAIPIYTEEILEKEKKFYEELKRKEEDNKKQEIN